MNPSTPFNSLRSAWVRFWHLPVRAERLALTRILLGVALLSDQLLQYLPRLGEFFGPEGVAPEGLYDETQIRNWYWSILFFNTDDLTVVSWVFWVWVAVTTAFTLGLFTRLMTFAVWFLTYCFLTRNPNLLNGGDGVLQVGLLWLLFAPSGRALSLDAWWLRRRGKLTGPAYTPPWSLRVLQIQLCTIYLTTGLAKVARGEEPFVGSWWDGTSVHYVINAMTMSRWSYAQLPLPLWMTATLTYLSAWWEVLFIPLVMWRRTRPWALWFGVLFHLGIWLMIEVGWFSFYTIAMYGVWVSDSFWRRFDLAAARGDRFH
jgi:hypothetical protein